MKQRDILFLSISVFAVIAFWIGFNIAHNLDESKISAPIRENIIPISPDFDTKTIETIKNRQNVEPLYETEVSSASSSQDVPAITEEAPKPSISPVEANP